MLLEDVISVDLDDVIISLDLNFPLISYNFCTCY